MLNRHKSRWPTDKMKLRSKFALYCAELVLDDPMKGTP